MKGHPPVMAVDGQPKSGMRGYQWARGAECEEKEGRKSKRGSEAGQYRVVDDDILESRLGSFDRG